MESSTVQTPKELHNFHYITYKTKKILCAKLSLSVSLKKAQSIILLYQKDLRQAILSLALCLCVCVCNFFCVWVSLSWEDDDDLGFLVKFCRWSWRRSGSWRSSRIYRKILLRLAVLVLLLLLLLLPALSPIRIFFFFFVFSSISFCLILELFPGFLWCCVCYCFWFDLRVWCWFLKILCVCLINVYLL